MAEAFGTQPADCWAYIGTCISQAHYEVDEAVVQYFDKAHYRPSKAPGKWMLCLKSANEAQLTAIGLPARQMQRSPYCSFADEALYFSHRRDQGHTGRMMAVIGIRA
ncbi:laccase domain-containing protein, partial [Arthrospira platensis SPKY1]|nr:laccase domain-containing protein [Arthrospira platensis SPKY1]